MHVRLSFDTVQQRPDLTVMVDWALKSIVSLCARGQRYTRHIKGTSFLDICVQEDSDVRVILKEPAFSISLCVQEDSDVRLILKEPTFSKYVSPNR